MKVATIGELKRFLEESGAKDTDTVVNDLYRPISIFWDSEDHTYMVE